MRDDSILEYPKGVCVQNVQTIHTAFESLVNNIPHTVVHPREKVLSPLPWRKK